MIVDAIQVRHISTAASSPPPPSRLMPWLPMPVLCCTVVCAHMIGVHVHLCLYLLVAAGTEGAARKGEKRVRHFARVCGFPVTSAPSNVVAGYRMSVVRFA